MPLRRCQIQGVVPRLALVAGSKTKRGNGSRAESVQNEKVTGPPLQKGNCLARPIAAREPFGLWLSKLSATICGVVMSIVALAIAINWAAGLNNYRWYALPIALCLAGTSFAIRKAIAVNGALTS